MKTNSYILARRTKAKKWEGVAVWHPNTKETCLAFAEYAFIRAGYKIAQCYGAGDFAVNHAENILRQKNYSAAAPLREIGGTVSEVAAWSDLNRAREYIANGWNLASQPEAQAAAIKAGLISAPVVSVETPAEPVESVPAPVAVVESAATPTATPSPVDSEKASAPASSRQTFALYAATGKDFRGLVELRGLTYGEVSAAIAAAQPFRANKDKAAALRAVSALIGQPVAL